MKKSKKKRYCWPVFFFAVGFGLVQQKKSVKQRWTAWETRFAKTHVAVYLAIATAQAIVWQMKPVSAVSVKQNPALRRRVVAKKTRIVRQGTSVFVVFVSQSPNVSLMPIAEQESFAEKVVVRVPVKQVRIVPLGRFAEKALVFDFVKILVHKKVQRNVWDLRIFESAKRTRKVAMNGVLNSLAENRLVYLVLVSRAVKKHWKINPAKSPKIVLRDCFVLRELLRRAFANADVRATQIAGAGESAIPSKAAQTADVFPPAGNYL